jgi:plant G-box-binding factor
MLQNMTQTNPFWAAQAMLHRGMAMGQSAALPQAGATTNGASAATDELTRKKLARKQSNRDSARRSRLRKQAETVEINVKVSELEREVVALREENQRLKKRLAENEGQRERKTTK